jgi:hypothetical protein
MSFDKPSEAPFQSARDLAFALQVAPSGYTSRSERRQRAPIRRWKEAMSTRQNLGYGCAFKALARIEKMYRSAFKN